MVPEDLHSNEAEWQELMGHDLILLRKSKCDQAVGSLNKYLAEVGDAVRISFRGRVLGPDELYERQPLEDAPLIDGEICSTNESYYTIAEDWVVTLGDADLLPALEMGVRFLPEHHVGIVRCHSKYAHGSLGRTSSSDGFIVPANSSVEYSITVHEILKSSADNFLEIDMLRSRWKKQIASDFYFRYAEYKKALQLYKSASDILQSIINSPINEEENTLEDAKRLLVDVCNNAALCQMKLNEYLKAKEYCKDALQRDPKNIKALCRTAKCCIVLGQYDEAESCLDKAKHYQQMTTSGDGTEIGSTRDSGSSSIQHMTHLLRQAKRSYTLKEKVMYRKMYKGIGGGELAHTSHFDNTENMTVGSTSDTPNDDDDTFRATASNTSNIINFAMRNGTWISLIFPLLVAFVAAVWFQCFANKRQEYSKPI